MHIRRCHFTWTTVYSGLGAGWGEIEDWIAANGYKTAEELWERYLTGMEAGPDPANWRTELNLRLTAQV